MNRAQVKRAADALGRLEALEAAIKDLAEMPHEALPITLPSVPELEPDEVGGGINEHGIKVYYPREMYREVLSELIAAEESALAEMGVAS